MKLPYVSLTDGKVSPPLKLPSYRDYARMQQGTNKDVSKKTHIERLAELQKAVDTFKMKLEGLDIFCKANPKVQ